MGPVMRGLCTLRELQDGTYSLDDLEDMQEAMLEEDEMRARVDEWQAAEAKKK